MKNAFCTGKNKGRSMKQKRMTEDEHIVPVFVLKKYCGDDAKLCVYDRRENRHFYAEPRNVFFQKNIYESRNSDGSYYNQNAIENRFSSIEDLAATSIRNIVNSKNASVEVPSDCHAICMLFVALQLIRGAHIKEMILSALPKDYMTEEENRIYNVAMYRMLIYSRQEGMDFLRENGLGMSSEIEALLKGDTFLDRAGSFIASQCVIYYVFTNDDYPFIISDNPVVVDYDERVKYVFPVSPNMALCCRLFEHAEDKHFGGYYDIEKDEVIAINQRVYDQAIRFVGYQPGKQDWLNERIRM